MSEVDCEVHMIIADHTGVEIDKLNGSTSITEDLGLAGDDVGDLVDAIAKQFNIDLSDYRWYHHSEPEGCNPFWLIVRPWWAKARHIPLTVDDLVRSAREGKWSVEYPDQPLQPKHDIANWLFVCFAVVVLVFALWAKCSPELS